MLTLSGPTSRLRPKAWLSLLIAAIVALAAHTYVVPSADAGTKYTSKKSTQSARKTARKRARLSRKRKARRSKARRSRARRASKRRAAKSNPRYAAYVIDAKTGKVLFARNADKARYPASLTKMMTLYILFEELEAGRLKGSDRVVMTKAGARRPPSKLGLRVGQSLSVDQAVMSLITKSANDVATAVGDKLSGSEAQFAHRMTRTARRLGMSRTSFRNASGLTAQGQLTTAADMARLGLALREHFPRRFKLFTSRSMRFGRRRLPNHNRLLGRVRGVDGIKTGYTRASGFNLVTSAGAGGRRIVAVVMGGRSGASRNAHMTSLVRRYLPKASRGKGRFLIAGKRKPAGTSEAKLRASLTGAQLPSAAPLPSFARRSPPASTASSRVVDVTPVPAPARPVAARIEATTDADAKSVDPTVTGTTRTRATPSGWHVQVAATDSRKQARAVLRDVRRNHGRLLLGTVDHVPTVRRGGTTFWRARFAGFHSKGAARRACASLRKRRVSCLALPG